jgi:hypothetical protein
MAHNIVITPKRNPSNMKSAGSKTPHTGLCPHQARSCRYRWLTEGLSDPHSYGTGTAREPHFGALVAQKHLLPFVPYALSVTCPDSRPGSRTYASRRAASCAYTVEGMEHHDYTTHLCLLRNLLSLLS